MSVAIKVENISKVYRLGEIGTGTISRDVERWFARVRGKEDPFLKLGEVNDRTTKGDSNVVWSLKDINFEIEQGDAVGIIGRNGAGKSTLLKILSRITSPTTGRVMGNGRVASLLEVGTGFNPELTGRENIYLNGAILGMRKAEIRRHFDAIVDFAGVERYIDTPVKRYSSGMYVRLAFAVAAYLESEILIVDEVLSVGDAEFQKKCLGKMNEVSKGEGRTVLFVSHNLQAVKTLCTKGLILRNGFLDFEGNVRDAVENYNNTDINNSTKTEWPVTHWPTILEARLKAVELKFAGSVITTNSAFSVYISAHFIRKFSNVYYALTLKNSDGIIVFDTMSDIHNVAAGHNEVFCTIPGDFMNDGNFSLSVGIWRDGSSPMCTTEDILYFKVEDGLRPIEWYGKWVGVVRPKFKWNVA